MSYAIYKTNTMDPWLNLAIEEYLLDSEAINGCILYLWQNQKTVVIGKNQNPWRECRTEMLEKEDGKLARRLSGGGAVFHDLGNLNFTFLMPKGLYDIEKQGRVILEAVKSLGIEAEMTGRNDILADGRKFSGNAFCFRKKTAYHHGTILVNADLQNLSKYLQVSKEKIQAKGIKSVKSRVVNLSELNPDLTINKMVEAMIDSFRKVYGKEQFFYSDINHLNDEEITKLYGKYSNWDWRYGEAPSFDIQISNRFDWGEIEIELKLKKGKIQKAYVYSDAMDCDLIGKIPDILEGCDFSSMAIAKILREYKTEDKAKDILNELADWIEKRSIN